MKRSTRLLPVLAAAAVTSVLVAACGSSSNPLSASSTPVAASSAGGSGPGSVVIGSANFPESQILMYAYGDVLTAKGVQVSYKSGIGSREIYYPQIKSGALSLFPEYNGALLALVDKNSQAVTTSDVDAELAAKLPPSLEVLDASAAEDKDSLNVTSANAKQYGLSSIGDLTKAPSSFKLGGPPEFKTRYLPQIKALYGVDFSGRFVATDEAGALTVSALKGGQVGVADIFSTDASIPKNGFVTLSDPKHLFKSQNVLPLLAKSAWTPTIVDALNAFSAKLTTDDLVQLVGKVANDHQDPKAVAADYVKSLGLS